jgi:hypothetical protein
VSVAIARVRAPTLRPQDSATLSGIAGSGSGDSLTFSLYGPGDTTCSGTALYSETQNNLGDGTYSTSNSTFTLDSSSTVGIYRWKVDFTGNSANNNNPGTCGDESFELGAGGIVNRAAS